jgi:hypothetical protein
VLRLKRQRDIEPVVWQKPRGAIRPFHQRYGAFGCIVETEFGQLTRPRQPIEIGVHNREARQGIGLRQCKGRAWHLHRVVAGEIADQCASKSGLACAQIARQRDQIAGFEDSSDVRHQSVSRGFVG